MFFLIQYILERFALVRHFAVVIEEFDNCVVLYE